MWHGAVVDIPAGFHLCDGDTGTPDLRNTFIVGAGDTYAVDDTGGSEQHNHAASGVVDEPFLDSGEDINAGTDYSDTLANDTVSITVGNANHLPPYYALAYIMKT